jgi:hypothetical protein
MSGHRHIRSSFKRVIMMRLATFILALTAAFAPVVQGQEGAISGDFPLPDVSHMQITGRQKDGTVEWNHRAVKFHPGGTVEWTVGGWPFLKTGPFGKGICFPSKRQDADPRKYQPKPPDKNDCLIVATEIFARLKNTAYWARIAGFDYATSERNAPGHAVVLYEPAQGSTVWLYDDAGSRDLAIKSHDLSELKEAIAGWLKGNARVSDIRWIGEEGGLFTRGS